MIAADSIPLAAGTQPAKARAPASSWYALAVLIATTLFAFVDRQVLNLIAPSLQKMLSLSDLQLGALQGLGLALFASAASYPIGWLADRYGRLVVLGSCVVLWSLSTAACAFQDSFSGLFVATAGIAIGEAALTPIIFSLLPDLFPERQRNTANFIFFATAFLGAAAGFGLGGAMLEWLTAHRQALPDYLAAKDSWRAALLIAAVPGPLFALLLGTIRMRAANARQPGAASTAAIAEPILPFVRAHWPVFACLYGTIAAYTAPMNSPLVWLPVAMPRIFGTPSSAVGLQLGTTAGIAVITGLVMPVLGMRWTRGDAMLHPLRMMRWFMVAGVVPALLLAWASTPVQVYVAAGLQLTVGMAAGALMPGLLQQISPPGLRARLLAILGIVGALASGLAPLLVGAVSGQIAGSRGILDAITIVGLPCWLIGPLLVTRASRHFAATAAEVKTTYA